VYATNWCGDCRMARRWFDAHGVPYEYINIEEDDRAAEYVVRVNHGARSVPTIVFPDGSILVEPSPRELASKLTQWKFEIDQGDFLQSPWFFSPLTCWGALGHIV
jgi:mycoredoxin